MRLSDRQLEVLSVVALHDGDERGCIIANTLMRGSADRLVRRGLLRSDGRQGVTRYWLTDEGREVYRRDTDDNPS